MVITLYVDVWRFVAVTSPEEKTIGTNKYNRRHDGLIIAELGESVVPLRGDVSDDLQAGNVCQTLVGCYKRDAKVQRGGDDDGIGCFEAF